MSSFAKEFLRAIAGKPGRFLAIAAIVALGAGFYAGLRMTSPDMDVALDRYLDGTNTYDVRIVSTMGLEDADLQALRALPDVEAVMGARQADALVDIDGKPYTARIHSLPAAASASTCSDGATVESDDPSYLNRLVLMQGRWPERAGECLIQEGRVLSKGIQIGTQITLTQGAARLSDTFAEQTFTVVGTAQVPYYVSSAAIDASSLGSGVVQQVMYTCDQSFADGLPYTDAFLTAVGARAERNGSQAYDALVERVVDEASAIADERCEARMESLVNGLYEGMTTYEGLMDLVGYRLSHTQAEMDDPELPEWLVMGRDKNPGMASFQSDAQRVDRIASVFPFIFFLVAALVALTSMTRMVDEERQLIGTHKALG
ncbi:MAG TPA: ABC transporter permease, partial [Eggerthellaceae bacterium]|nr:ABC transporter permease [Eggerthellaceae bacterium]